MMDRLIVGRQSFLLMAGTTMLAQLQFVVSPTEARR